MGYRSSVVCLMYGNNDIGDNTIVKEFVRSRVEAYSGEAAAHVKDAFNYDGWGVKFECQDWKWYDSYQEIRDIEAWFNSMDDAEFGAMRMGEDDNDTETWGQPYDFDICLNRYLSCPIDA